MPTSTHYSSTGNQNIDGILGDLKWAVGSLTYSFPREGTVYGTSYGVGENVTKFGALNGAQQAAVRSALQMYASVANLRFTEVLETATQHADLRFALTDKVGTAWAYTPSSAPEGGDVWFGGSSGYYGSPARGNYASMAFLHEIGHALGLEHPHEHAVMPAERDSVEHTVMSYRSYVGAPADGYTNEEGGYPQSLMTYDIAALQHMYGANFASRAGNTTYAWSPSTGEFFVDGIGQGAPVANRVFQTLWDGGGIDTYDFSNFRTDLSIDLRPGSHSILLPGQLAQLADGRQARGSVFNALQYAGDPRSLIENAIGGSGSNKIVGNEAPNLLMGGGGNDVLYGYGGNDKLVGGAGHDTLLSYGGNDVLVGGSGADVFFFRSHLSNSGNVDTIQDFSAADVIRLDNEVFRRIPAGTLPGDAFVVGARAQDAEDRIIYNRATGALMYDYDGTGPAAAVKFAQLAAGFALSHLDFVVV